MRQPKVVFMDVIFGVKALVKDKIPITTVHSKVRLPLVYQVKDLVFIKVRIVLIWTIECSKKDFLAIKIQEQRQYIARIVSFFFQNVHTNIFFEKNCHPSRLGRKATKMNSGAPFLFNQIFNIL